MAITTDIYPYAPDPICPDTFKARLYEQCALEAKNKNQTCALQHHPENRLQENLDDSLELIPKSPAFVFGERVLRPTIDLTKSVLGALYDAAQDTTMYAYNFFSGKSYENLLIQKQELNVQAQQLRDNFSFQKIEYNNYLNELEQMEETLNNQITLLQKHEDLANSLGIFSDGGVDVANLLQGLIEKRDSLLQNKLQFLNAIRNIEDVLSEMDRMMDKADTKFDDYESLITIFRQIRTSIRENLNLRKDVKLEIKRV